MIPDIADDSVWRSCSLMQQCFFSQTRLLDEILKYSYSREKPLRARVVDAIGLGLCGCPWFRSRVVDAIYPAYRTTYQEAGRKEISRGNQTRESFVFFHSTWPLI